MDARRSNGKAHSCPGTIPARTVAAVGRGLKSGLALAPVLFCAVALAATNVSQDAAGALPKVMRIGYLAQVRNLHTRPTADPAAVEVAAYAGLLGAREGEGEMDYTARLVGRGVDLAEARARTPGEALQEAETLVGEHVFVLVGGFDAATAEALSQFAARRRTLFFNVGVTDDRLRNEDCSRFTFHIEASDAMYQDAIADWFIRGLAFLVDENALNGVQIIQRRPARRWFTVTEDTPPWQARRRRTQLALQQRHWGGQIVGDVVLEPDENFDGALRRISAAHPDLIFLLLPPARQLAFYARYEQIRLPFEITGFPEPVTQTRTFFSALLRGAPRAGRGSVRMVSYEPTFAAIGGPQLAQRFYERWKQPLDGPAWTSWLAVKILWETFLRAQTTDAARLQQYLESGAQFEGYQGVGMTFRPWDHQLRHPLMASRLTGPSENELTLAEMIGQFPNVLAPGRAAGDVLDQLGDTEQTSRCRWR
jgi:branched-chain amino acid transport system substrate-binding protein